MSKWGVEGGDDQHAGDQRWHTAEHADRHPVARSPALNRCGPAVGVCHGRLERRRRQGTPGVDHVQPVDHHVRRRTATHTGRPGTEKWVDLAVGRLPGRPATDRPQRGHRHHRRLCNRRTRPRSIFPRAPSPSMRPSPTVAYQQCVFGASAQYTGQPGQGRPVQPRALSDRFPSKTERRTIRTRAPSSACWEAVDGQPLTESARR